MGVGQAQGPLNTPPDCRCSFVECVIAFVLSRFDVSLVKDSSPTRPSGRHALVSASDVSVEAWSSVDRRRASGLLQLRSRMRGRY